MYIKRGRFQKYFWLILFQLYVGREIAFPLRLKVSNLIHFKLGRVTEFPLRSKVELSYTFPGSEGRVTEFPLYFQMQYI